MDWVMLIFFIMACRFVTTQGKPEWVWIQHLILMSEIAFFKNIFFYSEVCFSFMSC